MNIIKQTLLSDDQIISMWSFIGLAWVACIITWVLHLGFHVGTIGVWIGIIIMLSLAGLGVLRGIKQKSERVTE